MRRGGGGRGGATHRKGDWGGGVALRCVCGGMGDTSVSESPLSVRCALSCAWWCSRSSRCLLDETRSAA